MSASPWWETIARGSKSFAFAARLLPPAARADATVIYAWCRRADDAVDGCAPADAAGALARLEQELRDVYEGPAALEDPLLEALRDVFRSRGVPREYPAGLLDGMRMDVEGRHYRSLEDLLGYCFCVAGTVGLMMAHVMDAPRYALPQAARMGMAMQLTNICRDVLEDWHLGRIYLPTDWLSEEGGGHLVTELEHREFPISARPAAGRVVRRLLAEADRYYRAGDEGLRALTPRCAFAIHTARLVYSAIGDAISARGYDVTAGRAVVPMRRKLVLAGRAAGRTFGWWPRQGRSAAGRAETAIGLEAARLPGR